MVYYVLIKLLSDLIEALRELPFAYIRGKAETYITKVVFNKVMNQSLDYHLNRETGKILRTVQKGAKAFVNILNILSFRSLPILLKIVAVTFVILFVYDFVFLIITYSTMVLYILFSHLVNQWRSKYFKDKSKKDIGYN